MSENALIRARKRTGLTMAEIAGELGTHPNNYFRVERGEQMPKRDLARRMFEFFDGEVTLAECYDPVYAASMDSRQRRAEALTHA